jgi:putative ABC transport system permease protein
VLADIQYALRLIRKTPAFTASVVLTIALGIGATTAIFSVVNAVLLRPLPFVEPQRLFQVAEKNDRLHLPVFAASVLNFVSWREQIEKFDEIGAVGFGSYAMSGRGEPEQFSGFRISPSVLRILGLHPVAGRSFQDDEERPSAAPVAMLDEGLWRRRFGADPSIIGQTVTLNGVPTTLVGIAPAQLAVLTSGGEIWTPLVVNAANEQRLNHLVTVIGRVKRGVSVQQAQTEMDTIAARVRQQYPEIRDWGIHVVPFFDMFVSPQLRTALWVLLAAVGFVLLIACANITNLLLARAAARQQEIAVRTALGASRPRLLRQMLVESLTFAALGGAGGLLLAFAAVRAINRALPPNVLPMTDIAIDGMVLWFASAVTVGAGIVFGVLPAHRAASADLNDVLKRGGRSGSAAPARVRNGLAAAELALATLLLIAAGLMVQTVMRLQQVTLGFQPRGVLTFQVAPPASKYTVDQAMLLYRRMLAALHDVPGVRAVGMSSGVPFGSGAYTRTPTAGLGPTAVPPDTAVPIDWRVVSPGYFQSIGMTLIRGRDFDERDDRSSQPTAIVSQAAAHQFWGNDDPIGRVIRIVAGSRDFTIVGVVDDVRSSALNQESPAMYFSINARSWPTMDVAMRTDLAPESALAAARREIGQIDPELPLSHVRTMDEWVAASAAQPRLSAMLIGVFAGAALLLAAVGTYGVIAYSVAQRRREIGLRIALGAQRTAVLGLVVREGMTVGAIGVAGGVVAAVLLGRALSSLLFGIDARDPLTYVAVTTTLGAVALVATAIPARRAAAVDPMIALRE